MDCVCPLRVNVAACRVHTPYFLCTGAVELENLPLRKDALREFDLPFEVKAGEEVFISHVLTRCISSLMTCEVGLLALFWIYKKSYFLFGYQYVNVYKNIYF